MNVTGEVPASADESPPFPPPSAGLAGASDPPPSVETDASGPGVGVLLSSPTHPDDSAAVEPPKITAHAKLENDVAK
jgi:hypothetical protein